MTIVYEDSVGSEPRFGLHEFLLACARDLLVEMTDEAFHKLKRQIRNIPANGNSNVIRKLAKDAKKLANRGHALLAVLDNDKIRNLLDLRATATEAEVQEKIRTRCGSDAPEIHFLLLDRNMESVLIAAESCGEGTDAFDQTDIRKAVDQKDRTARDQILIRIATARRKAIRDCIQEHVPTVNQIASTIARLATSLASAQ